MYIRSYVCMCVLKCVLRAAITLRILWALHALTYCPVVKFILALTRAATCMNARGAAKQWQGRRQSLFAVYTQIYICNEACWVTSVKALGGGEMAGTCMEVVCFLFCVFRIWIYRCIFCEVLWFVIIYLIIYFSANF